MLCVWVFLLSVIVATLRYRFRELEYTIFPRQQEPPVVGCDGAGEIDTAGVQELLPFTAAVTQQQGSTVGGQENPAVELGSAGAFANDWRKTPQSLFVRSAPHIEPRYGMSIISQVSPSSKLR